MKQMKELLQKAESNGIKTVFGMQGQTHPLTKLIKETIAQDKIGKVLSSNFIGTMVSRSSAFYAVSVPFG